MNPSEFTALAEEALQQLFNQIEEADTEYVIEADLLDGILTLDLPDGGQYIINKHDASMQIWMSSPRSGASHFSYQDDLWVDRHDNELATMLAQELEEIGVVIA